MDAHFVEQRKGAAGRDGWVPSFWLLLWGKQKKVTRQQGERVCVDELVLKDGRIAF